MKATKKMLSIIFTFVFTMFTLLCSMPVQAGAKKTVVPEVQFASAPVTEYTVGDRIQFNINSPNFGGKVEYRVVLWNDSQKSYGDLWNEDNGYLNCYYTKWQPTGNTIFTLGWPIFEPGNYRITVYAKRVGVASNKAALIGMNCDSYKESVAFTVKPKITLLDKEGQTYGSSDANKLETYKGDIKVTANNIVLSNAKVEGDLYISGDNAVIKNISATGKIVVDPGKNGSTTLEAVIAKNIEILSGGQNSIHIKNVQAETMNVSSSTPVRVEADGDTEIVSTSATGYVIFDRKSGTYGTITIIKGSNGVPVIEFRGDIKDKVEVETTATIKTGENSKISNLVIATKNDTDTVKLEGKFAKVEINSEAKVEVAANTKINNIVANKNAEINLDKTAVVDKVDKGSNTVVVGGEGQVGPSAPPVSGGSTGGSTGGGGGWYPPVDTTIKVSAISVTGAGNVTTVANGSTLQMSAAITPTNATYKTVTWAVTNGTGEATIDASTGLLSATGVGTVTVKATNAASGIVGTKDITVTAAQLSVAVSKLATAPNDVNKTDSQANQDAVTVSQNGNAVTISGNLGLLKEFASTNPAQGTHKWVGLVVATGETSIIGVKYGAYDFTQDDVNEANSVGAPAGSFVLWIKADDVVTTPKTFTLATVGKADTTITINFTDPNASITTAKGLVPATKSVVEGTDTNLLTMLNAITGMSATGVTLTLDVTGNANVAADGTITYTGSEVVGNVIVKINKADGTEATQTVSVTVPVHAKTAKEVAAGITTITAPAKDATSLTLPTVEAGYTVAIKSSDTLGVIALDGTIVPPAAETTVALVLTVTRTSDSSTADTVSINVVVSAKTAVKTVLTDAIGAANANKNDTKVSTNGSGIFVFVKINM